MYMENGIIFAHGYLQQILIPNAEPDKLACID